MELCRKKLHEVDRQKHKQCPSCKLISRRKWDAANPHRVKAMKDRDYKNNHQKRLISNNDRYKKMMMNPEFVEQERARKKLFKINNRRAYSDLENRRRFRKIEATPKWLTDSDKDEIKEYYSLAKDLSWLSEELLVVDHIIPLSGKEFCGLHVPWNLQIISKSLNCSKGNRVEGWVNL